MKLICSWYQLNHYAFQKFAVYTIWVHTLLSTYIFGTLMTGLGTIEAISNLAVVSTSSAIVLTWQPPFSLNLTTAEPDIIYCIDIFNMIIIDGEAEADHLINNCSVFKPFYEFTIENPDPKDLFQFVVTPRNNE